MTIHTIVFVIVTILSLTTAYALGKPAPTLPEDAQQSGEESSTDAP
jgi:hypothetical protein